MGVYSSLQNRISPKFGQFGLFLAIFRYPEFLKIFPMLTYLWNTSRYNILHLMGVTVLSRISFYSNLANLGCFCPFLGTQSSWKFSQWLPNIKIHQDITFYTYLGGTVISRISFQPISIFSNSGHKTRSKSKRPEGGFLTKNPSK